MSENDALYAGRDVAPVYGAIPAEKQWTADRVRPRILLGPIGLTDPPVGAAFRPICDVQTFSYCSSGRDAAPKAADYCIDPATQDYHDLLDMLSQGTSGHAMPDYLIYLDVCNNLVLPGLDRSTFPVVGIVSNWDRTIDKLERCISIFDCVFVGDAKAIPLLESIGGRDVRVGPLTGFSLGGYDSLPDTPGVRPHDITFIGDIDGEVWRKRGQRLERVAAMADRRRVFIRSGITGEAYRRELAASKIVFSCPESSWAGSEVHNQCFEAMAAGAMLLTEDSEEIRALFSDRIHCVLYNEADLEETIEHYLEHDEERETIASAGRAAVRSQSFEARAQRLIESLVESPPDSSAGRRTFSAKPPDQQHFALSVGAFVTSGASFSRMSAEIGVERQAMAEREARAAVALRPSMIEAPNNLAVFLMLRGMREQRPGEGVHTLTDAEAALQMALAGSSPYPTAMLNMALLYRLTGRDIEASTMLRRTLRTLNRGDAHTLLLTGMVACSTASFRTFWQRVTIANLHKPEPALQKERARLLRWAALTALAEHSQQVRNFSEASSCYGQAVRVEPEDGASKHELGLLAWQSGNLVGAVRSLESAVSTIPHNAKAWLDLGQLYLAANLLEKARLHVVRCRDMAKAMPQLSPGVGAFDHLLERIEQLTPTPGVPVSGYTGPGADREVA